MAPSSDLEWPLGGEGPPRSGWNYASGPCWDQPRIHSAHGCPVPVALDKPEGEKQGGANKHIAGPAQWSDLFRMRPITCAHPAAEESARGEAVRSCFFRRQLQVPLRRCIFLLLLCGFCLWLLGLQCVFKALWRPFPWGYDEQFDAIAQLRVGTGVPC
jgi:hypothetical protein